MTAADRPSVTDQALAEAWAEGHRTGWEHCQDGNYGNDYWDDPTPNPYAAAARAETTTKTPPAEAGATADDAVEDAPGEQGGSSVPPCSPGGRAEKTAEQPCRHCGSCDGPPSCPDCDHADRPSVTPRVGDTITTAEQLDALPSLAIVIDANDEVQQRHGHLSTERGEYSAWLGVMPPTCKPSPEVALPVTVLYVPGEQPGPSVTDNARAEAVRRWPRLYGPEETLTYPREAVREHARAGFIQGAEWAADRAEMTTDDARAVREAAISLYRAMRRANPDAWAEVDEVEDWTYWDDIVRTAQVTLAAGRAETTTAHECDSGDFDRTICDCGAMHSYCTSCGTRQDDCPHETTTATTEDAALTIRCDIFDDGTVELNEVVASNATPNRAAGLLATARTRPTREDLARAIAAVVHHVGYEPDHPAPNRHDYRAADAVLALLRGGA